MTLSTEKEDARMLFHIPLLMNKVINDQLTLKLVIIEFDNTLQILSKYM